MKQDPGGTSVESKTEYPHAPFPAADASPARTDVNPNGEDTQPRWKLLTILLHVIAAVPVSILFIVHQHQAVLIGGLIAAFPALFMLAVNKTLTRRTVDTESFWKKPYTVFLIGFSAIAIGVLLIEGFPTYQDTKQFYAVVEGIQEQIDFGEKDAVRELAYLYLNKESPVPHPYTHLTLNKKGAALLEEWVTTKMQADEGDQYAEDMYNLAKSVAWYDKEKAHKWFSNAHRHGHKVAMQQLEKLQSDKVYNKDQSILVESELDIESNERLGKANLSSRVDNDDVTPLLRNRNEDDLGKQHDSLGLYDPEKLSMGNTNDGLFETAQPTKQPSNTKASFGPQYSESLSIPKIREDVLESYQVASNRSATELRSDMTWMLSQKEEVSRDADEAAQWYRKAAEQGDANAQSNLGWMYFKGQGVTRNYEEAVKWYRKAAAQGDAAAQSNLGWMYENGKGVPQDNERAVSWYLKAAEQGYAAAQSNLGAMYGNGKGVERNVVLAHMWSDLAARQGYQQGEENRLKIAVKMTRLQISEAQRQTREWMEAHEK